MPWPPHPPPCPRSPPQVHPELLTKALLARVEAGGGALQAGAVAGVRAEGGRLATVVVRDSGSGEEREVPADAVVFALGRRARVHCDQCKMRR